MFPRSEISHEVSIFFRLSVYLRQTNSARIGLAAWFAPCGTAGAGATKPIRYEALHHCRSASRRERRGACPRHLFAQRQLAVLLQTGDQQRLCAAHIAPAYVESRCAGGSRHLSANHGQLSARHLRARRVVGQASVPEVLRRAEHRRRVRQRPPRGRAPRGMDGLHLRDHEVRAVRHQQLGAGDGEQLLPERHSAHLVGDKLLRRHLPRRGA